MPSKTLDDVSASIKRLKARAPKPKLHTYKVSIMGPSLDKPHLQTVQAESPGAALDMVLRAAGCTDCTQYAVLRMSTVDMSTKGAA